MSNERRHRPLRIGIVGFGYIGTTVGEQFHRHSDAIVAALCDLDGAVRDEVGRQFDVSADRQYATYEAMLTETPLDAVLVGTPHMHPYEQVLAALDSGCHVYCDKPLTTDLERASDQPLSMMVRPENLLRTTGRQYRWDRDPPWVPPGQRDSRPYDSSGV
ncbi:oxidoreductase family protein [Natrinema hispanicum]|uniref:Oxidoreductase family protein n=1 Tax=Natrinema hispanicum TaxID=392421 RepID=A0A482Y9B6_9EURY|nr:oxidoreductase family protein [Natrinema hispanicum]